MITALRNTLYRTLRWSEKYTKTDMVYLAGGGFWLIAAYGVQVITGLVLAVAFANLLTKEAYGTYQFIIAGAALVSVFTLTGMGTAVFQQVSHGVQGALRYGFRVQLVWSVGIVFTAAILSGYYFIRENTLLSIAFAAIAVLQPLIVSLPLYKLYLQGTKRFKEHALLDTFQRLIPFVALIVTLFVTRDPLVLVIVFLVIQAFSLLLMYIYTVRKYELKNTPNPEMKKYSKHLSVMESFTNAVTAADKVIVWTLLGAAPVAIYALALLPIVHLQTAFGFVRQLAFPKIAERTFSELRALLPQKIGVMFIGVVVAVGIYIAAAPFIFDVLFPQYSESVIYSQILALTVLAVPFHLIRQTFLAHKFTRELYILNISTPLLRVVSAIVGVFFFGIWGVVIALLLSEIYAALLQVYLLRRAKERV